MRIDAHHHFWQLRRGDYGWLTPDLEPIFRDFDPGDLVPFLARHRIDATILVQSAPTDAETRFLLDLASRNTFIAGVVGWADFESRRAPEMIGEIAGDTHLVGLRPMVQDLPDDDWLLLETLQPAFAALAHHDLVFDALVLPRHLTRLRKVVDRNPDLTVVIDHMAKPFIADEIMEPWAQDMAALAEYPNVVCKLSGLVTEAKAHWTTDDLKPFVDKAMGCFSPSRILWGSDWPVVNLAGGYDAWRTATDVLLRHLSEAERRAVLGDNAARIYLSKRGRKLS